MSLKPVLYQTREHKTSLSTEDPHKYVDSPSASFTGQGFPILLDNHGLASLHCSWCFKLAQWILLVLL